MKFNQTNDDAAYWRSMYNKSKQNEVVPTELYKETIEIDEPFEEEYIYEEVQKPEIVPPPVEEEPFDDRDNIPPGAYASEDNRITYDQPIGRPEEQKPQLRIEIPPTQLTPLNNIPAPPLPVQEVRPSQPINENNEYDRMEPFAYS